MNEFVVFDPDGTESEWIDPVVSVTESDGSWLVDNGFAVYEVPKQGRTMQVRTRVLSEDDR